MGASFSMWGNAEVRSQNEEVKPGGVLFYFFILISDFIHLPSRIFHSNTYRRNHTARSRSRLAALFSIATPRRFLNSRPRPRRRKRPPAILPCETGGGPWRKRLRWQPPDSDPPAWHRRSSAPERWPCAWRLQYRGKRSRAATKCTESWDSVLSGGASCPRTCRWCPAWRRNGYRFPAF